MGESILISIKKALGITEEYTHFDSDLIMHINSAFATLLQLGVGPDSGFSIIDKNAIWETYLENDLTLEFVKTYVYMKVKMVFDPPLSSAVIEAMNKQITELEFRISAATDSKKIIKEEL